ncbi:hypothetical protein FCF24_01730, partial [Lacticaseibacillus paracasei]
VGPNPTGLIVQFSDRTQLAMTPSDTVRASSNRRPNGSHGQLPKRMGKFIGFESRRLHIA